MRLHSERAEETTLWVLQGSKGLLGGRDQHRFSSVLQKASGQDQAARALASEIVSMIFESHPSPTGKYGEIPVGRE